MHAKRQRSLKKSNFLIWNKSDSKVPWATAPKLVLWLANTLSCDLTKPYYNGWSVDEIWDTLFPTTQKKLRNICDPASSKRHNSGVLQGKIICQVKSQLRLVESHNTSMGAVAHGALELDLFQIRKWHFFSDPCLFALSSKKKNAYRDISHIILKHTQ